MNCHFQQKADTITNSVYLIGLLQDTLTKLERHTDPPVLWFLQLKSLPLWDINLFLTS